MAPGLNLKGKCKNPNCPAFKKQVLIKKGFGSINIIKEVHNSACPVCGQLCTEVNNMCLYTCRSKRVEMIKGINE
jgi:hypothetical protein